MGLRAALRGRHVCFDTNIFIYILEGSREFDELLLQLREAIELAEFRVTASALVYAELLPPLIRSGKPNALQTAIDFLSEEAAFDLIAADHEICVQAAFLRAEFGLKTPDALHVATAIRQGCDAFLTNDRGIRTPQSIERFVLSEWTGPK